MKLATALSERADIQRRISDLSVRLNNNAKVQEGEKPSEDPEALLEELDRLIIRLEELISRINRTNNETRVSQSIAGRAFSEGDDEKTANSECENEGEKRRITTLTDLIAHKDCLSLRIKILREFLNAASERTTRYLRSEIKILSTVSVADLQKKTDILSKELRETDEKLQALNWSTTLL